MSTIGPAGAPATEGRADALDSGSGPRSVHRALELLTIVVESGPQPLTELARASRLPTSTTLRSLRALEHWGYVARATDGGYVAGHRFARSRFDAEPASAEQLFERSGEVLQRLTERSGESSYLTVRGPGRSCIYLREVQSDQPIRHVGFAGWAGRTVQMDGSAVGAVLDGETPHAGFVTLGAVSAPDATVIAAPVLDNEGTIVAAISIVGPSFRMGEDRVQSLGGLVCDHAQNLTEALRSERSATAASGAAPR
ncbi:MULTISPECIES: IclR family transcriptional regulator [unclassified Microbacterium]|uniref:IclR family transcriptional regulator n=1 Tax=unclassified Microbacterium TaxID=2609290 RepID=UPI003659D63E